MSHVLPTQVLFHSFHFSTHQNRFLIFPASTGDTLRIPPLYPGGQVKHHIQGRSDSLASVLPGITTLQFGLLIAYLSARASKENCPQPQNCI